MSVFAQQGTLMAMEHTPSPQHAVILYPMLACFGYGNGTVKGGSPAAHVASYKGIRKAPRKAPFKFAFISSQIAHMKSLMKICKKL